MEAIDLLLERAVAEAVGPGAVAVIGNADEVLYEGAAGSRRSGEDAPLDADTMFRIASMTSPQTGAAVLQLAEQGRLALDQSVASVIPPFGALQLLEGFDGNEPRLRPLE